MGSPKRELEEPALEHVLELDAGLGETCHELEAEARPDRLRQPAVPGHRAERVLRSQLEARVRRIDRKDGVDRGMSS